MKDGNEFLWVKHLGNHILLQRETTSSKTIMKSKDWELANWHMAGMAGTQDTAEVPWEDWLVSREWIESDG